MSTKLKFSTPTEFVRAAYDLPGDMTPQPAPPEPVAAPARPSTHEFMPALPDEFVRPSRRPKNKGGLPSWDHINPQITRQYSLRMSERHHAMLTWIVDNTPRCSIQKIVTEAIETEIERRLAEFRD